MKTFAVLAALFAGVTSAAPGESPQGRQVGRTCHTTVLAVSRVVAHAATTRVTTITSHFRASAPGKLTGEIVFNPSGSSIRMAADVSGSVFSCAAAEAGAGVPAGAGHSRVVAAVQEKFARGVYTLTLPLNAEGKRILTHLGARQSAYHKRHPHGHRPPTIALGVTFSYTPAG